MRNIYNLLEQNNSDTRINEIMLRLYKDLKFNILNDWISNLYKVFQRSKKLSSIKKLYSK